MRLIVRYILASPLIFMFVLFDIIKIPALLLLSPVWLLMDLIDMTKGEKSSFLSMMKDFGTMGLQMCADLLKDN